MRNKQGMRDRGPCARVEPRRASERLQLREALPLQIHPPGEPHRLKRHLLVGVVAEAEAPDSLHLPPPLVLIPFGGNIQRELVEVVMAAGRGRRGGISGGAVSALYK